jgi:hypothetical protein
MALDKLPYLGTTPNHEAFYEPSRENYSPICPFRNEETRINSADCLRKNQKVIGV